MKGLYEMVSMVFDIENVLIAAIDQMSWKIMYEEMFSIVRYI